MTGLELLDVVKQTSPDLPVIMITAYGDAGTEDEAKKRGALQLVSKPVDFNLLNSELVELSEKSSQ